MNAISSPNEQPKNEEQPDRDLEGTDQLPNQEALDDPSCVTSVENTRGFPDEDLAFVEMTSVPQRWLSPLRVGVEPKSRRFVQPQYFFAS